MSEASRHMDWRIYSLYRDFFYGYQIEQTWFQRLKGKLTGRYSIKVWSAKNPKNWWIKTLTSDYQACFNSRYFRWRDGLPFKL